MPKLQYSLKTQLLGLTLLITCLAILHNRARAQWLATREISAAGGQVYFSLGTKADGFASKHAAIKNYLPHVYQSISHVTIRPNAKKSISDHVAALSGIPGLNSLCIYPGTHTDSKSLNLESAYGATDEDIEAIATALPQLAHFNALSATCDIKKGYWLEERLPNLKSGSISWHLDIDERGFNHHFDK